MKRKRSTNMRLTEEDRKILGKLRQEANGFLFWRGLSDPDIVRIALRKLAASEGLKPIELRLK